MAIIYPVLMAVIVALQAITDATRTEQSLQVAADRAAQTAALCCETIGHAAASAKESLAAALSARGVACVDDTTGLRLTADELEDEVDVVFYDRYGNPRYDAQGNIYYYDSHQYPTSQYRRMHSQPRNRDLGRLRYGRPRPNPSVVYVDDGSPAEFPNRYANNGYHAFDEDGNPIANPKGFDPNADPHDPNANWATTSVPRAGRAEVLVTCMLETGQLGRTVAGPDGVRRHAVGQSVVDPYRQRAPAPGP